MNLYLFFAILACRLCAKSIYSLSIKKVAIVGCGPAGLMLAASLKRLNCGVEEVFLFDKRSDVLNIGGGGLQISGGSVVMEKIGLLDEIINIGHPLHNVLARNSQSDVLLNLDIKQLVTTKAKEELCINDKPVIFSIMRNALQNILYNAAMASDNEMCSVKIIKNAKCKNIVENSNKVSLEFDNNEKYDDFDMVFGTDGVNSVVRSFTSSGDQKYFSLPTAKGDNAFTGIRITYCVSGVDNDFTLRPNGASTFHQYFGDGLYVLAASYGGLSGIQHMLAIVYYDDKTNDLKVNPDWVTSENPKEIVLNRLVSAGLGDNQEIINLLNGCDANSFIDLAVTDETIPLKSWSSDSNRIILAGDAAHPMVSVTPISPSTQSLTYFTRRHRSLELDAIKHYKTPSTSQMQLSLSTRSTTGWLEKMTPQPTRGSCNKN